MFADLEDRYGLHRLKKDLRWQRLQVEVLSEDVLIAEDKGCGRDEALSRLDAELKVGGNSSAICSVGGPVPVIGKGVPTGCQISKCYRGEIESFYKLISEVKGEGEGLTAIGEDLPAERRAEVQSRFKDLQDRGILRKVAYELSSCVQALNS